MGRPKQKRQRHCNRAHEPEHLIHHDNTFGTPEEDAFRRDFTINALVYDIATFSIIDYVGGLEDLRAGIVRSIGDPEVRLREDPVRMLRAVALAARLDFAIDPPVLDAIRTHRHEIARSSAPRLLEEYYKILRAGSAEKTFRMLADAGPAGADLDGAAPRRHRPAVAVARGARHVPPAVRGDARSAHQPDSARQPARAARDIARSQAQGRPEDRRRHPRAGRPRTEQRAGRGFPPTPKLGELPLARRDVERLRQILALQRRLRRCDGQPARPAGARAPKHLSRSADVVRDPRRRPGRGRALEGASGARAGRR